MDRSISLQAAIDEIKEIYEWHDNVTEDRIIDHLQRLPSVQPEIIRCKDCKFYTAHDYTGKLMCKRIGKGMILPKPEDYCSYAE